MSTKKSKLTTLFRIREWLIAKWLFNLTIGLAFLLSAGVTFNEMLKPVGLIMLYVLCVGAFGYFINDLFDRETDLKAGKSGKGKDLHRLASILIPVLLLAIATVPYIFLLDQPLRYLALLCIQAFLLFTYSAPFVKIKTHFLGLAWDALYSYILPALITVQMVSRCVELPPFSTLQIALPLIWLSLLGLRSILNHQLSDFDSDTIAGLRTFAVAAGKRMTYRMSVIITGMEILFFAAMVATLFDFLWRIVVIALLLFLQVEVIIMNKSFVRMVKEGKYWTLVNHFYDYYLFMGVMTWISWIIHPAFLAIPLVFIVYRLSLHTWLYHHLLLWIYYKGLGLIRRISDK